MLPFVDNKLADSPVKLHVKNSECNSSVGDMPMKNIWYWTKDIAENDVLHVFHIKNPPDYV